MEEKASEQKFLDEATARIRKCAEFVYDNAGTAGAIGDRLQGSEPDPGGEGKDATDPQTIFDALGRAVGYLEDAANTLSHWIKRLDQML